jgi:hypothetical protein
MWAREGKQVAEEKAHLSTISEDLNERFGTVLGTADQLFFDQLEETWMADDHLVAQARANPMENFRLVFQPQFIKSIVAGWTTTRTSSSVSSMTLTFRPR